MENNLSPIVLFVYNRPEHTKKTLNALIQNELASDSDLIIFADGPKVNANEEQLKKICETRNICKTINGFKTITINEFETNKGLAQNIILGVTNIVNQYGKVIVLEDDIITGQYFLKFMNDALNLYEKEQRVYAVSGWYYPIEDKENKAFFLSSFNCWGWATWKDRWATYKKDCSFYKGQFTKKMIKDFNIDNKYEYWSQIIDNEKGIRNTWFIFWYAGAYLNNGLCLFPTKSLVSNSGCDGSGENCSLTYFKQNDDINIMITDFPKEINIDFERKELLKNYLVSLNKKYWVRTFSRKILRKLNLYGLARKIYKKVR